MRDLTQWLKESQVTREVLAEIGTTVFVVILSNPDTKGVYAFTNRTMSEEQKQRFDGCGGLSLDEYIRLTRPVVKRRTEVVGPFLVRTLDRPGEEGEPVPLDRKNPILAQSLDNLKGGVPRSAPLHRGLKAFQEAAAGNRLWADSIVHAYVLIGILSDVLSKCSSHKGFPAYTDGDPLPAGLFEAFLAYIFGDAADPKIDAVALTGDWGKADSRRLLTEVFVAIKAHILGTTASQQTGVKLASHGPLPEVVSKTARGVGRPTPIAKARVEAVEAVRAGLAGRKAARAVMRDDLNKTAILAWVIDALFDLVRAERPDADDHELKTEVEKLIKEGREDRIKKAVVRPTAAQKRKFGQILTRHFERAVRALTASDDRYDELVADLPAETKAFVERLRKDKALCATLRNVSGRDNEEVRDGFIGGNQRLLRDILLDELCVPVKLTPRGIRARIRRLIIGLYFSAVGMDARNEKAVRDIAARGVRKFQQLVEDKSVDQETGETLSFVNRVLESFFRHLTSKDTAERLEKAADDISDALALEDAAGDEQAVRPYVTIGHTDQSRRTAVPAFRRTPKDRARERRLVREIAKRGRKERAVRTRPTTVVAAVALTTSNGQPPLTDAPPDVNPDETHLTTGAGAPKHEQNGAPPEPAHRDESADAKRLPDGAPADVLRPKDAQEPEAPAEPEKPVTTGAGVPAHEQDGAPSESADAKRLPDDAAADVRRPEDAQEPKAPAEESAESEEPEESEAKVLSELFNLLDEKTAPPSAGTASAGAKAEKDAKAKKAEDRVAAALQGFDEILYFIFETYSDPDNKDKGEYRRAVEELSLLQMMLGADGLGLSDDGSGLLALLADLIGHLDPANPNPLDLLREKSLSQYVDNLDQLQAHLDAIRIQYASSTAGMVTTTSELAGIDYAFSRAGANAMVVVYNMTAAEFRELVAEECYEAAAVGGRRRGLLRAGRWHAKAAFLAGTAVYFAPSAFPDDDPVGFAQTLPGMTVSSDEFGVVLPPFLIDTRSKAGDYRALAADVQKAAAGAPVAVHVVGPRFVRRAAGSEFDTVLGAGFVAVARLLGAPASALDTDDVSDIRGPRFCTFPAGELRVPQAVARWLYGNVTKDAKAPPAAIGAAPAADPAAGGAAEDFTPPAAEKILPPSFAADVFLYLAAGLAATCRSRTANFTAAEFYAALRFHPERPLTFVSIRETSALAPAQPPDTPAQQLALADTLGDDMPRAPLIGVRVSADGRPLDNEVPTVRITDVDWFNVLRSKVLAT